MTRTHGFILFTLLAMVGSLPTRFLPITATEDDPEVTTASEPTGTYDAVLASWRSLGYPDQHDQTWTFTSASVSAFSQVNVTNETSGYHASEVVAFTEAQGYVSYTFDNDQDVLVEMSLDYLPLDAGIRDLELALFLNDAFPFQEAQQLTLNKSWITSHTFAEDRYRNQIMPKATLAPTWQTQSLRDAQRLQPQPFLFFIPAGTNTLTLFQQSGQFLLGHVRLASPRVIPTYATYRQFHQADTMSGNTVLTYQAEHLGARNSLLTRFTTNRDPRVMPFALIEGKLNVIDGATYQTSGQRLDYTIEVPASGWYDVSFKVLQNRIQTMSYRRLTINGLVPFEEANRLAFPFARQWSYRPLADQDGNVFQLYLSAGTHTLGLEVNASQARFAYETIRTLMADLNALTLAIKKITGNTIDPNREWNLIAFLPSITTDLDQALAKLDEVNATWTALNQASQQSDIIASLNIARRLLVTLRQDINRIPRRLNTLAGASGSVLYRLGIILPLLIQSPLTIDAFYVHGRDATLPPVRAGFFLNVWIGIQRFFASFFSDQFKESTNPNELVVWVSRSRQYVNLLQQMVDATFTPASGIPVRVNINPNEDKLILASSANRQPDVAMGIAGWRPYDFAIRNNVYDLTSFPDFRTISDRFYPGSFMQLIYQDGVYGLPETQNFYLLFYRTDIMDRLNLSVPDTWQDVIGMLPELQRFGMNFYSMLSSTNAFKAFVLTMPFINQFGGKIIADDALSAAYDDPHTINALTFMTDLYTTYSLPLEVGSFYNEFRYGRLPIGIGDFGMYISLLHAAPEIAGLWNVAPLPGHLQHGQVNRAFDGSSTSAMIFKNSTKTDQAWSFLKWWTEASTQLDYAENLISAYGPEYLWNTSNRDAFAQMSWDKNHQNVMLEQWAWIQDTAKTPAAYMLERELSNIWNKVVYNGVNLRTAIEDSLIISNKEIRRKMLEFGFIDRQGNVLRPYQLPTLETLHLWVGTTS